MSQYSVQLVRVSSGGILGYCSSCLHLMSILRLFITGYFEWTVKAVYSCRNLTAPLESLESDATLGGKSNFSVYKPDVSSDECLPRSYPDVSPLHHKLFCCCCQTFYSDSESEIDILYYITYLKYESSPIQLVVLYLTSERRKRWIF